MTPTQNSTLARAMGELQRQAADDPDLLVTEPSEGGKVRIEGEVDLLALFLSDGALVSLQVVGTGGSEPLPEDVVLADEFPGNCAIQVKALLDRVWPAINWEVRA